MSALAQAAAPALGGVGALTGALILSCLAFVVAYGLLKGYDYTFGALIRKFADMVEDIWLVGGKLADALDALDHYVLRVLGTFLSASEKSAATLFDALAWVIRETGDALVEFASDTADAIGGIVGGEIPTQIENRTNPLKRDISAFRRQVRSILEHELARFRRGIDGLRRDIAHDKLLTFRGIDHLEGRLTGKINALAGRLNARITSEVGSLRRPFSHRLTRLEKLLGFGVIGAIAVGAMTRVFPYWQCTNVRRFNRGLCRSPIGALDWLFALAALAFVTLDPEEIYETADDVAGLFSWAWEEMSGVAD